MPSLSGIGGVEPLMEQCVELSNLDLVEAVGVGDDAFAKVEAVEPTGDERRVDGR